MNNTNMTAAHACEVATTSSPLNVSS